MREIFPVAGLVALAAAAYAQGYQRWLPGEGVCGISGTINVLQTLPTPNGLALFAGGRILAAGDVATTGVAFWRDGEWHAQSNGLPPGYAVTDFTIYNGALYASLSDPFDQGVFTWNGTAWAPVTDSPGRVSAMQTYNNQLIVAGNFDSAGALSVRNIVAFDGSTWSRLGTTSTNNGVNDRVNALTVYGGNLIVGGNFITANGSALAASHVAGWDGTNWFALGTGVNDYVNEMEVFQTQLYVGYGFGSIENSIRAWDGTQWGPTAIIDGGIGDFQIYDSVLYAATTHGTHWLTPPNTWTRGTGTPERCTALGAYEGALVIGGQFTEAGGVPVANIARIENGSWSALGTGNNGAVRVFHEYGGALHAFGDFTTHEGTPARHAARWNGTAWEQVGSGLASDAFPRCAFEYQGQLIVGGSGLMIESPATYALARWDGANWLPPPFPLDGRASIYSMTEYEGKLFIAGQNIYVNGNNYNVARLDPTGWTGIADWGFSSYVLSLTVWNGELVAAGSFPAPFGSRNIARWSAANGWRELGLGLGVAPVSALVTINDVLIAGGGFTQSGSTALNGLAYWTGVAWAPLPLGTAYNSIDVLHVAGDELFLGGYFQDAADFHQVGRLTSSGVEWLDTVLPSIGGYFIHALHHDGLHLNVGGGFTRINGVPTAFFARYRDPRQGDSDGDGDIDIQDLANLLAHFGACRPQAGYDPNVDFDNEGCVTLQDLAYLLANFGT